MARKSKTAGGRATFRQVAQRSHVSFLAAAVVASVAALAVPVGNELMLRLVIAWDTFALTMLAIILFIVLKADAEHARKRASAEDPGRAPVQIIVLGSSLCSLVAAVFIAHQAKGASSDSSPLLIPLCILAVGSAWFLTHAVFTLRYAHLYYNDSDRGSGLEFPGTKDPDDFDFAYFSFTVGMTFQVSDTPIHSRAIRRQVLQHAVLSFLYTSCIFALVINLIGGQAK